MATTKHTQKKIPLYSEMPPHATGNADRDDREMRAYDYRRDRYYEEQRRLRQAGLAPYEILIDH